VAVGVVFTGCISRLVVSGVPVNLGADMVDSKAVTDCPVCATGTCRNGGSCQPAAADQGFKCLCLRGYSGPTCQLIGDKCTPSKYHPPLARAVISGSRGCIWPVVKLLSSRDDNGSHFLTRDPRDPLRFVEPRDP